MDDVVGFYTSPAAGCGNLTHILCVSLFSLIKETMSKTCLSKIGQYHLAQLNSPRKEAYE